MKILKNDQEVGEFYTDTLELKTDDQELERIIHDVKERGFDEPIGGQSGDEIAYGTEKLELGPKTIGLLIMRLDDSGYTVLSEE